MSDKMPYINRELSWIEFNKRVLKEAKNQNVPLFERLKFVAIYTSNMDEFFMVRVGSLFDQALYNPQEKDSRTQLTATQQLELIYEKCASICKEKDETYKSVLKELAENGVRRISLKNATKEQREFFSLYFEREVLPLLSPQIIDKQHPFPFLENKKLYIGVKLQSKNDFKLGIVPVDSHLERIVYFKNSNELSFVLIEDIILYFVQSVFNKRIVIEKTIFRVTRNADIDVNDNLLDTDIDYRDAMEELLKKRKKLAPVRLELHKNTSDNIKEYLGANLKLEKEQIFKKSSPLDFSFVFTLEDKVKNKELFNTPLTPQDHPGVVKNKPMFEQILKKDLLLHYPYYDIKPLVRLLEESAQDKNVVSIKMTLYRVARDSKIINALINAAENGIDVSVVVELKARFDEMNNIDWSKRLIEAGCNVVYGVDNHKVHSKLMLIVRKNGNTIEQVSHIGTGNFNEKTAKFYTDLSLITSNNEICQEVSAIFNALFLGEFVLETKHLLVAPLQFKSKIIKFIDEEIQAAKRGEKAEIVLKINSFTDKILIDKLIDASNAGVKINMIVRGICCIKPGIEGCSENIRVISIVGRFLEHSRIYVFGCGERRKIYISSADFMTRNTERRVEVATPIYDKELIKEIVDMLSVMFRDNVKASKLLEDGSYEPRRNSEPLLDSQNYFYLEAYKNSIQQNEEKVKEVEKEKRSFFKTLFSVFKLGNKKD